MDPVLVGRSLRDLRAQKKVGLRELCRMAELSPATLSSIENGQSSPTLATLHRILRVLDTDFATFFAASAQQDSGPVFPADSMTQISDGVRQCTFVFPRSTGIKFAMAKESQPPQEGEPEWETHDCDLGAILISGGPLQLEVADRGTWTVNEGDSFYIPAGTRHRGRNLGKEPARLITTYDPPRY